MVLQDWFRANKLTLHLDKTNVILFRPKGCPDIDIELKIGNVFITRVKSTKFLGLEIDEFLSWEYHGKQIASKGTRTIFYT